LTAEVSSRWCDLMKNGVISEQEFEAKKAELLKKVT
jgi:hypothetical protein